MLFKRGTDGYAWIGLILVLWGPSVCAGPYNEPGVSGYVDVYGQPANLVIDPNAVINPIFRGWATGWRDYMPADTLAARWSDPTKALGPATGDADDVVVLGDLDAMEIQNNKAPGEITMIFANPADPNDLSSPHAIRNEQGYDFAVFENGFSADAGSPNGTVAGYMFAELAFVEVSSDGQQFARFPTVSGTPKPLSQHWTYLTMDVTTLYNLAGKHTNSLERCSGTPFDLQELADDPLVQSGQVDLNKIHYVRLVDIPGSGDWTDDAATAGFVDPNTSPDWQAYTQDHQIYDSWLTLGTGGFDLEAVGILKPQQYSADINLDGRVNLEDFRIFSTAWQTRFGGEGWVARCDLLETRNLHVDLADLMVFTEQWLRVEEWAVGQ